MCRPEEDGELNIAPCQVCFCLRKTFSRLHSIAKVMHASKDIFVFSNAFQLDQNGTNALC